RELDPGPLKTWAQDLVPALAEVPHHPQLLRACQERRVRRSTPPLGHLLGIEDLRLLVLERRPQCPREVEHLTAGAARPLEQPANRLEVEAIALELLDQLDPCEVLIAVVAGAPPNLRWRDEAARLVRANVPHRHPRPPRQLVDRHRRIPCTDAVAAHLPVREFRHTRHGTPSDVPSNDVTLTRAWVYAGRRNERIRLHPRRQHPPRHRGARRWRRPRP